MSSFTSTSPLLFPSTLLSTLQYASSGLDNILYIIFQAIIHIISLVCYVSPIPSLIAYMIYSISLISVFLTYWLIIYFRILVVFYVCKHLDINFIFSMNFTLSQPDSSTMIRSYITETILQEWS